jgi:hypothetical protein
VNVASETVEKRKIFFYKAAVTGRFFSWAKSKISRGRRKAFFMFK